MSSINKSTSKKKKADYSDDLFLKPIVESSEETERDKQEKIKRVLNSYHKGIINIDILNRIFQKEYLMCIETDFVNL